MLHFFQHGHIHCIHINNNSSNYCIHSAYVIIAKRTDLMMPICKIPIIGNLICTCPNGYSRTIYDWGTPDAPCNNGCVGRYKPNSVVNGKKKSEVRADS